MLILLMTLAAISPQREYLTEVNGPVVEAEGSAADIATRGRRCIASQLGSGIVGGELIISDDAGVIVARSASSYADGLMIWQIRSRVTFEARDGRFRISQTSLERQNDQSGGWSGIGKWRFSGWQKAEAAFTRSADELTACVSRGASDDW